MDEFSKKLWADPANTAAALEGVAEGEMNAVLEKTKDELLQATELLRSALVRSSGFYPPGHWLNRRLTDLMKASVNLWIDADRNS